MEANKDVISDLLMKHSRDINQLLESDKAKARNAIRSLAKLLDSKELGSVEKCFFFEHHVLKNFLVVVGHKSDSVRETCVAFLDVLIGLCSQNGIQFNNDTMDYLIAKVCSRVDSKQFAENVEEIRLEIAKLLVKMVEALANSVIKNMQTIQNAVLCLLGDKFADVKRQTSVLIIRMCELYPKEFCLNVKPVLFALLRNCRHSHSRVRKDSSLALKYLIQLPSVGDHMEEMFSCLYEMQNDKNKNVVQHSYECIGLCLNRYDLDYLKQYEDKMILFMLNGLVSDDTRTLCTDYLDTYSQRRKKINEDFNI